MIGGSLAMDVIVILVLLLIVLALAGTIPLPWRIAEIVEPNRALMLTACIGLLLMLLLWRLVRWMSKITGLATKIVEKLAVVFSVVLAVTAIVMIMVYESPTLA
jgi:hypothetical protein